MEKVNLSIRLAREDEMEKVWQIRRLAILHACVEMYEQAQMLEWAGEEMTEGFSAALLGKIHILVMNNQPVATGMIDLESGKVDAIFVSPEHMGKGYAGRMMQFLENMAREAGLKEMYLDSTLNAADFYRKFGFNGECLGKCRSPRAGELDCVPMRKILDAQ